MSARVAHAKFGLSVSCNACRNRRGTYGTHRIHINDSGLSKNFSKQSAENNMKCFTLLSLELASFLDEIPERRRSPLERPIRLVRHLSDIRLQNGVLLCAHRSSVGKRRGYSPRNGSVVSAD